MTPQTLRILAEEQRRVADALHRTDHIHGRPTSDDTAALVLMSLATANARAADRLEAELAATLTGPFGRTAP